MPSQQMLDFWAVSPGMPEIVPVDQLPAVRQMLNAEVIKNYPILAGVETEKVTCDEVSAVWYHPPKARAGRVMLYIHGGAFIWGSGETQCGVISRIAAKSECAAIALDYKLAPEHPFPGPVEEGVRLYKWLLRTGYPPGGISVVGDSAGGGLVLSVVLALKREGIPLPACTAIASAFTDLTLQGESIDWVTMDPCVTREGLEACSEKYLNGHDPADPLASPIFADLSGFPPTLVQVGSRERLFSDSTRFAARADAAGVKVKLEVYDGCVHLWHWWVPDAPEAHAAIVSIGAFVTEHTA